ncbi:MAG: methyltransferase domain-containing protein [Desulfococcaceae bacterium]
MQFFIHNSFHSGDVVLTRSLIESVKNAFPSVSIILECTHDCSYLWEDFGFPVKIYEEKEYKGCEPTANCPAEAVFINTWFGLYDDIFSLYELTYANLVHSFNRQMYAHNLHHSYQLSVPRYTPMITFYINRRISVPIRGNGILVENGDATSGQNYFFLNEHLEQIVKAYPQLIFYCTSKPSFAAHNVTDCSMCDLIELSQIGNICNAFLMRGAAINAVTQTEINRYKPRCVVGWDLPVKIWNNDENPVVYAENSEDINLFLDKVVKLSSPEFLGKMCKFLKSRAEVDQCTAFLHQNGYASHLLTCKDWDIAHIANSLSDGHFLDMGSSESYILKNAVIKGIKGEKYGIDLRRPDVPVSGVKYIVGDLMDTKLPSQYFSNITCLSVIEHEVDLKRFAAEVSRLLAEGGKLFLTFDYWEPKIKPGIKLYGLPWNILDKNDVLQVVEECRNYHLHLVDDIDWTLGDAVIRDGYYSPEPSTCYTFGMLVFQKKSHKK